MKTVCNANKCVGCMACIDICPKDAIVLRDDLDVYNAVISESKCIGCNACHNVCPNNNSIEMKLPQIWFQGWAADRSLRINGSSGGVATAISKAFIKAGGFVFACTFKNGEFLYACANNVDQLSEFSGSKYVKSNPRGIYRKIKENLDEGKKVLFIGLPCHVAAIKNYVGEKRGNTLYTIDLICHGTPSPKLLELYLGQYGCSLSDLKKIQFRVNSKYQICGDNVRLVSNGVTDKYSISFLQALTFTDNCYECQFAQIKRGSDLTLGDSWGSKLEIKEQRDGISLVLCQTEKGKYLLDNTALCLRKVDLERAVSYNHQLKAPSVRPPQRDKFWSDLRQGYKFNYLIWRNYPKQCLKQDIKQFLIKIGLFSKDK